MKLGPAFRRPGGEVYRLTEYDVRTGANQRRFNFRSVVATAAAGQLSAFTPKVEANRVLVLTQYAMQYYGPVAGAEVIRSLGLLVYNEPQNFWVEVDAINSNLANLSNNQRLAAQCELMLMPGESLRAEGTKSAAVEVFSLAVTLWGYSIPRGNIQTG